MKRFLLFAALCGVSYAAGTVQQSISQLGQTNNWVVAFSWTGDASTGGVPSTPAQLGACCNGYLITQVETAPGTPSPTAGYSLAVNDSAGVDVLGGAAAALSSGNPQAFAAAATASPIQGTFSMVITGQVVAGAKGVVYVFLAKPGTVNLAALSAGGAKPVAPQLATSPLQYYRSKPNTAAGSAGPFLYEFAALPVLNTTDYNFPAMSCDVTAVCRAGGSSGMSLSVGANTLSLAPCPLGVAGANTVAANRPQLIYVTGGTGVDEAEPVTAGTCTSGAASGTIVITSAGTHSAGWTLRSDSSGAQECLYVANPVRCALPPGVVDLWGNTAAVAALNIPLGNAVSLRGAGMEITQFSTHGTTNNWIYANQPKFLDIGDFSLRDSGGNQNIPHSSGTLLTLNQAGEAVATNMALWNAFDAFSVIGGGLTDINNLILVHGRYGFYANTERNGALNTALDATNIRASAYGGSGYGPQNFRMEGTTTGVYMANCSGGNGLTHDNNYYALVIATLDAGQPASEEAWTNCDFEGPTQIINNSGTPFVGNWLIFSNTHFNLDGNNAAIPLVSVVNYGGVRFVGCTFSAVNTATAYLLLNNTQNITIDSSDGYGAVNNGIQFAGTANTNINIAGGSWGLFAGGADPGAPTNAIAIANGVNVQIVGTHLRGTSADISINTALTGAVIQGNDLDVGATTPLSISGTVTGLLASRNKGVDDQIPAIASAATLALQANPNITITGTTGVTAVTFPLIAGSKGTLITTAGSVAFTSGATVGQSCTTTQNKLYGWLWDGTKFWMNGPGC